MAYCAFPQWPGRPRKPGELCVSLANYYRRLREYGLNDSHSGNASVRIHDCVWITAAGASGDDFVVSDLVACSLDRDIPENASSDARIHLETYRAQPYINAIFHAHPPYTIGLTMDGERFGPIDLGGRLYCRSVPILDVPFDDLTDQYVRSVSTEIAQSISLVLKQSLVVIVRTHGVYSAGAKLEDAYKRICT
ncbi:MAG: class II aldolase/adducin family protein, partial [Acidiferrobacterales bacterium]